MENINVIIDSINNSKSFDELKQLNILPEPDYDDGYYFVSYSHKDYKQVLIDIVKYKDNGIKIWYDRGLEVGKSWLEDVCRKIDSFYCKGVIAYVSDNFMASSACKKEMEQVGESNKSLMVIDINQDLKTEEIGCYGLLKYEASIDDKIDLINMLPKPELYEFAIEKARKIGRYAKLVRTNDKNIEIARIPQYYYVGKKKYHVRVIDNNAFLNCVNLREVYLPDGWFIVFADAFSNCYSLQKVEVGKPFKLFNLIFMGAFYSCFTNCISLKNLDFLKANKKKIRGLGAIICANSFRNCTSLEEVIITKPFSPTDGAFMDCTSLKRAVFNGDNSNLHTYIFANCTSLEEVVFKNVKSMGMVADYAFAGCNKMKELELPDSIAIIYKYAFLNMTSLEKIHLPLNLRYMTMNAFDGCENLKELDLPKKLKKISLGGSNNIEKVIIRTSKMLVINSYGELIHNLKGVFPNLKVLYCVKNSKYKYSGLIKVESDMKGFDKYIVEEKYE